MTKWQLQDAKARFSELIDDTVEKGSQMVTRRGIDTGVVVLIEEWHKLNMESAPTWKDVLLGEGPRFELPLPSAAGSILASPWNLNDSIFDGRQCRIGDAQTKSRRAVLS